MRLQVTVRHGQVNDAIRGYVEAKFRKLERRLHDATQIQVVLDRERNPKIADDHVVEATIHTKGPTLHGRESATTYEAATDLLIDKLERQVERYRDKRTHERHRRSPSADVFAVAGQEPEEPAELEEPAA
jgi:ribosome hibernation promoting factor